LRANLLRERGEERDAVEASENVVHGEIRMELGAILSPYSARVSRFVDDDMDAMRELRRARTLREINANTFA
jgi:hypothetical protein